MNTSTRLVVVCAVMLLGVGACDDGPEGDPTLPSCDDRTRNGEESDIDCGGSCGPCATGLHCFDGEDCTSRNCEYGTCASAACDDRLPNGDETDIDCGGSCPTRCPGGAACGQNSDCASYICDDGTCVAPACDDEDRNGDETDVDCGGSCPPCVGDLRCNLHEDCLSRICNGGICEYWACDDGVFNGDETDVDCGGSCERCGAGAACALDDDCDSRICDPGGTCTAPRCDDELRNGDESDVDCGGSCEPCLLGDTCNGGADCETTYCDNVGSCEWGQSCFALMVSAGLLDDGIYVVRPDLSGALVDVYCDMTTDGGGWTLVASSLDRTFDDRVMAWSTDLTTLFPAAGHDGLWDGMRSVIADDSDIRFSCKGDPTAEAMRVDLSFYSTSWYREITTGDDDESCFSPADDVLEGRPAPARRDIVGDVFLRRGNPWNDGGLVGEDACDDSDDFAVDFDDRGMGGDGDDGTDWGEADGSQRCGFSRLTIGSWFVWVREAAPHCVDGEQSEGETGTDCGGVCEPCLDGQGCSVGGECVSGVCIGSICQHPSCFDDVFNGDETDIDCGGPTCDSCRDDARCAAPSDCESGACVGGRCQPD